MRQIHLPKAGYLHLYILAFLCVFFVTSPAHAYHSLFDGLLSDYVVPSQQNDIKYLGVDYDAWAADPRHQEVVEAVLDVNADELPSEDAKKAYWLNAYNILTIDMIIQTGERENITHQGDALKTPFSTYKWNIGGKDYTLALIQKDHLMNTGDPRVLFAMNSGSISCADLRREAYRPARLEAQLRDQVLVTFKNETKGIKFEKEVVRAPKFLDTNKTIFKEQDVKAWLRGYYPDHIDGDMTVGYFQHHWDMNTVSSKRPQSKVNE